MPRRVIAKVDLHPRELFRLNGFVVTELPMDPDSIVNFYNQRGIPKQRINKGKQAINWTRSSCNGMSQNEVRLPLHALTDSLGVLLQSTDLTDEVTD